MIAHTETYSTGLTVTEHRFESELIFSISDEHGVYRVLASAYQATSMAIASPELARRLGYIKTNIIDQRIILDLRQPHGSDKRKERRVTDHSRAERRG